MPYLRRIPVGSQFLVLKPRNGSSFNKRCSEKRSFWRSLVLEQICTGIFVKMIENVIAYGIWRERERDGIWNAVKYRRKHRDAGMLPGCFSRRWSPCVWKAKRATLHQWPPMWRRGITWGQLHQNSKMLKRSPSHPVATYWPNIQEQQHVLQVNAHNYVVCFVPKFWIRLMSWWVKSWTVSATCKSAKYDFIDSIKWWDSSNFQVACQLWQAVAVNGVGRSEPFELQLLAPGQRAVVLDPGMRVRAVWARCQESRTTPFWERREKIDLLRFADCKMAEPCWTVWLMLSEAGDGNIYDAVSRIISPWGLGEFCQTTRDTRGLSMVKRFYFSIRQPCYWAFRAWPFKLL